MKLLIGNKKYVVSIFVPFLLVFGVCVMGYADVTPVSDRTPQVRDAIVNAVWRIESANDVTAVHLAAITELDLEKEFITSLKPGDFDGLSSLTKLDLSRNRFASLPEGVFSGLSSLTSLRLGYNRLASLPEDVFSGLSALTWLYLAGNRLVSLPEGVFSGLSSLTSLSLGYPEGESGNLLTSLPEGVFSGLSALTSLSLYGNLLTSLPEGVFSGLSALTSLSLSSNLLTSLPADVFSGLPSLTSLRLYGNRLTSLPEGVFSGLLPSLTSLGLGGNLLTSLPADVFSGLPSLTSLGLSYNLLTSLPEGVFSGLPSLTSLYLPGNLLTSLPEGVFSGLFALTELDLDGNLLTSLPGGVFSGLSSLTRLRLDGNRLRSLSGGVFSGLSSLTRLRLDGNPVDPFPFPVLLEKVADGQFKAVAPAGAPFEIVLPLTVTNGSINGGATSITIPVGSVESKTFTVTRISGTTAVTVNIGTLPGLPTDKDSFDRAYHQGYTLVISAESGLTVSSKSTTSETPTVSSKPTTSETPADTGATVSISPASVASPTIGEQLTLSLNIAGGEAVAGYQAIVLFDTTALRYVSSENGDYLPAGTFFVQPVVEGNLVKFNAASLAGESSGDGALATLTFDVVTAKASTLTLSDVLLTNSAGEAFVPHLENAQITKPTGLKKDVNGDDIVNIQDLVLVASNLGKSGQNAADVNGDGIVNIQDLVLVAGALGTSAAAPALFSQSLSTLTAADVKLWLSQAQQLTLTDAAMLRGIRFLEQLLAALIPEETALLPNYPNPFNPETWIPYHLAKNTDVTLHIYAMNGTLIRTLALGHQSARMYQSRSRAAYWDGKNEFGEAVASGVYFYTLSAGDFTATRKMLIRK